MTDPKHVFIWQTFKGIPFQHHGVCMGDGTVVHFCNDQGGVAGPGGDASQFRIRRTSMRKFSPQGDCYVRTVSHAEPLDAGTIRRRAERMVGCGGYDLMAHNCEHFASWCVAGKFRSRQVAVAAERAASIGTKITVGAAGKFGVRSLVASSRLVASGSRAASPWMLAADGIQWATEALGHHVGLVNPEHRVRAGRAAGGVTAAAIGLTGGPIGMLMAVGFWAAGETAACGVERLTRRA